MGSGANRMTWSMAYINVMGNPIYRLSTANNVFILTLDVDGDDDEIVHGGNDDDYYYLL